MKGNENLPFVLMPFFLLSPGEMGGGLYQKFDRKTDYAKAVVNLHNKRVLLVLDHVSKSTLLLCTINKNEYVSKYYLQFSHFFH